MKYTKKINDPFLSNLPILDLHGETYEMSKVLTKIFLEENINLKNKRIIIIHGKGKGIVKEAVNSELRQNKYVESFNTDNFNDGMTIVNLK